MKLNLLPKSVAKNVQSKGIAVVMLVLVLATLVGAMGYSSKLSGDLESYKREADAKVPLADKVVQTAASADQIISKAKIVLTNSALVKSIDETNKKYPALYDELRRYVPSFLRVRTVTASSAGPTTTTITIQGYLKTFQQYSDVMIALLRFPGCSAVGRGGFGPVAPGDAGPFGYNPSLSDRGPIPGWSAVTLTMVVARDMTAPDPRATLSGGVGAAPGPGGTAPGAGGAPGGGGPAPVTKH